MFIFNPCSFRFCSVPLVYFVFVVLASLVIHSVQLVYFVFVVLDSIVMVTIVIVTVI